MRFHEPYLVKLYFVAYVYKFTLLVLYNLSALFSFLPLLICRRTIHKAFKNILGKTSVTIFQVVNFAVLSRYYTFDAFV